MAKNSRKANKTKRPFPKRVGNVKLDRHGYVRGARRLKAGRSAASNKRAAKSAATRSAAKPAGVQTRYPYHRFANLFPLMKGAEFDAFAERVGRNGLRRPIVLFEGKILDGRNRDRACDKVRVAKDYRQFDPAKEGDPLDFVLTENLDRRQLTPSQVAMVAAELATLTKGGAGRHAKDGLSQDMVAELNRISRRTVQHAVTVRDQGSAALQRAVRDGDVAVSTAAEIASSTPKGEQMKLVAHGEKEILGAAKAIRAKKQERGRQKRLARAAEAARGNGPLPDDNKANVILIDIPREFRVRSKETGLEKSPDNHYPVMDFDGQAKFMVDMAAKAAAPDCALVMCSTAASLIDDIELMAEAGFLALRPRDGEGRMRRDHEGKLHDPIGEGSYRSHQVWQKVRNGEQTGTGYWFTDMHELYLLGIRGDLPAPLPGTQARSLVPAKVGRHSEKTSDIRETLDGYFPDLDKLELFGRGKPRTGWRIWGNEAEQSSDQPAAPTLDAGIAPDDDADTIEHKALAAIVAGAKVVGHVIEALRGKKLVTGKAKLRLSGLGERRLAELVGKADEAAAA